MKNNSLVLSVFQTQIKFAKLMILCDADIVDDKIHLVWVKDRNESCIPDSNNNLKYRNVVPSYFVKGRVQDILFYSRI